MQIKFYKLTATGNDFILFFNFQKSKSFYSNFAKKVCDRHYGIGADGIIILKKSKGFNLRYFNLDGSEAFCGNGTRASAFWLKERFNIKSDFFIKTISGDILCKVKNNDILIEAPRLDILKSVKLPKKSNFKNGFYVFAGTHHLVIITEKLEKIDVLRYGSFLRYSRIFKPHGVNVNFVEILKRNSSYIISKIRTYEKGVEGETLSCASGASASFYVMRKLFNVSKVNFITKNNEKLFLETLDDRTFIRGDVKLICSGVYYYLNDF